MSLGIGLGLTQGRRASGPPPFAPTAVAGLLLWLKADAGTNQTAGGSAAVADGDPVGEWLDQSGQGLKYGQATPGKRPLLKLNIRNGKPVLRFDGADDFLLRTVGAGISGPRTFFFVFTNTGAGQGLSASGRTAANAGSWDITNFGAGSFLTVQGFDDAGVSHSQFIITTAQTDPVLVTLRMSATDVQTWMNGGDHVTNNKIVTAYTPSPNSFGSSEAGALSCAVDLCEVIGYGAALSDADRQAVEAYLKAPARWNMP